MTDNLSTIVMPDGRTLADAEWGDPDTHIQVLYHWLLDGVAWQD